MFWNAVSTFEASNAEVSINDRLFSSTAILIENNSAFVLALWETAATANQRTREMFCLFGRDRPQVPQIALVTHEHDHNVRVRMITQFLEPSSYVCESLLLGNVVHQKSTDSASVVAVLMCRRL
jgi:hypothetical protein